MTDRRDSDYAYHLTDAEQRTLDLLLARVDGSSAGSATVAELTPQQPRLHLVEPVAGTRRRSRYLTPAAAAAAAAVTVSVLQLLPTPDVPVTPQPGASATAGEVLDRLGTAAGQAADPPAGNAFLYQSTLNVVISQVADSCVVTAVTAQTWTADSTAAGRSVSGRLVAAVSNPPAAAEASGCTGNINSTGPARPLFDGTVGDVDAKWADLRQQMPGSPSYTNPRWVSAAFGVLHPVVELPSTADALDPQLDKLCANFRAMNCAALRWTVLAQLLSSPEVGRAQRAAALKLAAGEPGAVLLPVGTANLSRVAGTTLRVPYVALNGARLADGGRQATAELTFDASNGELLQRLVLSPDGARSEFTVYLSRSRTATPG